MSLNIYKVKNRTPSKQHTLANILMCSSLQCTQPSSERHNTHLTIHWQIRNIPWSKINFNVDFLPLIHVVFRITIMFHLNAEQFHTHKKTLTFDIFRPYFRKTKCNYILFPPREYSSVRILVLLCIAGFRAKRKLIWSSILQNLLQILLTWNVSRGSELESYLNLIFYKTYL